MIFKSLKKLSFQKIFWKRNLYQYPHSKWYTWKTNKRKDWWIKGICKYRKSGEKRKKALIFQNAIKTLKEWQKVLHGFERDNQERLKFMLLVAIYVQEVDLETDFKID